MANLTLQALEVKQNGTRLLLTKMKAGDLPKYTEIEVYDPQKDFNDPAQGYQRQPEMARVKKFANWLKNEKEAGGVRMPTAILLSARGTDIALSPNGTITLKGHNKLPLVDGQHRMRGFDYAITDKALIEFADYEVPVVIMMEIDKVGEMRQFNTVNGTVKSVRTDLVNMILTQLADQEGNEAVREAEHWKVVVSKAVQLLNNEKGGPWEDQIVMPNSGSYAKDEIEETPELAHHRVVRATSFMTSLKPIEAYLTDHHATPNESLDDRAERLAKVISEYWKAIRAKMPECFENANDYVLQKTPGVFALHILCKQLLRDMHTGRRPWTEQHFAEMLTDSAELADPGYWAVGSDEGDRGEGAKYGSMKGFAELADLLRQGLQG
jgi:DGQHR domain-containing protein